MPELPEVETTVFELKKKVLGRVFLDVWTDWEKMIKKPKDFQEFKKGILGKKIKDILRKGKLILFKLEKGKVLLFHQKLTGHLLVGKWTFKEGKWQAPPGPLSEKINTFLHLVFTLDKNLMIALSDLRKFAFVELWDEKELEKSQRLKELGPDPLDQNLTFEKFEKLLKSKKGKIKQILMDQSVISGIGNIYSDEILWKAKVHPLQKVKALKKEQLKEIFRAMKEILKKAIKLGGESISDYRKPNGQKGKFDLLRNVYRREGEKCKRCSFKIKRLKIAQRSSYFCPHCQKL